MLTRRHFIAGAAATAFAAPAILRAQSCWRRYPFSLGVAAGDPSPDGFVIWTRLAPEPLAEHGGMAMAPMPVSWEVASDERLRDDRRARRGSGAARARPRVHVEVAGPPARPALLVPLPGRRRAQHQRPGADPAARRRPAPRRCASASPAARAYDDGYYTAYRHLAREELAFVYHYGDYIYEYRGGADRPRPRRRADRRGRARSSARRSTTSPTIGAATPSTRADPDLQRAHAAHAFFHSFDDHEIADNWVQEIDRRRRRPRSSALRRAAALQAWYEHMPVRRAQMPRFGEVAMHRGVRFGNLAEIDILDTRQFRSNQPCDDGFKPVCAEMGAARLRPCSAPSRRPG